VTPAQTILVGIYSPFAAWNIPASHVAHLREIFPQHTFLHATSEPETVELIPRAQIAFMSEVRPDQFAAAEALQWIHSPAAGVGGMLFPAIVDSAVVMTNSRGISGITIADTATLPEGQRFDMRVRATVEIGDLPAAVRMLLFWKSWSRTTEWYAWKVRP